MGEPTPKQCPVCRGTFVTNYPKAQRFCQDRCRRRAGEESGRIVRPDVSARNKRAHQGNFLYEDASWMREAYTVRMLSIRQISIEAQCGMRTVARWMATHGIATRAIGEGRRLAAKYGPANPGWSGKRICPRCGNRKTTAALACQRCRDRDGVNNPKWRGYGIGYAGAHERVRSLHGSPSGHACDSCGEQAEEWSYQHTDPDEKFELGQGWYSVDPRHYLPLCRPCHRIFDGFHRRNDLRPAA